MTANPWDKFFWNDWESDPALRVCSLAAQGLWMRMLCLAAKATPVGYVKVGDQPCTAQDLARLVGEREETVSTLLAELENRGVFSRARNSTIYNRRMVRNSKKREKLRENGSKGGKSSALNGKGIFADHEQNSEQHSEQATEPYKPEAISNYKTPKPPDPGDLEFEELWRLYRRKSAKELARTAFRRARKLVEYSVLLAAVKRYLAENSATEVKYLAYLATWLNQKRYLDYAESEPASLSAAGASIAAEPDRHWRRAIERYRNLGSWPEGMGMPPADPACEVPMHLLIEYGYRKAEAA